MRIKITSYTLCNWTQTGRRCSKNLLVDQQTFYIGLLLDNFLWRIVHPTSFFPPHSCSVSRHVGWRSCLHLERKSRLWFRKFLGTCSVLCMGWALGSSNQRTQELSVVRHKYQIVDWEICPSWCSDVMLCVGWTLNREQWSQHHEFVETNIGIMLRTLPHSIVQFSWWIDIIPSARFLRMVSNKLIMISSLLRCSALIYSFVFWCSNRENNKQDLKKGLKESVLCMIKGDKL